MSEQPTTKQQKVTLPDHYVVVVEGTYLARQGRGDEILKYKFTFPVPLTVKANMPEKHFDAEKQEHFWKDNIRECSINEVGILSYLLRSRKILDACIKHDPRAAIVKTYEITSLTPSGDHVPFPQDPRALSFAQIKKFIRSNGWQIDVSLFPTKKKLVEAVSNYKEAPDSYPNFESRVRRSQANIAAFAEAGNALEAHFGEIKNQVDEKPEI